MPIRAARRRKVLSPSLRGQEQLFQIRSGHPLQPPPLLDGNKNGSFRSTPGYDLRPFGEGGIEKLAEPRLGVLDRPLFLIMVNSKFH